MRYLLSGVAAIAMMTACDQSGGSEAAPLEEITLREGDPADAPDVISAMMLTNSGDGALAYESKDVDGANATFSNVTIADMDGVTIDSLVFEGLDMIDGQAAFSRMSFSGITYDAPEEADTSTLTVGEIELINPSPALAAWVAGALGTGEPADFPSVDQVAFDAWAVSDVSGDFSGTDAEGKYKLSSVNMRDFTGDKAALAEISGLSFDIVDEDDMNFKGGLDSMSVSGADLKFLTAMQQNAGDEEAMAAAMMSMMMSNPMEPGYDRISLDNFTFAGEGMDLAVPSVDAYVERNNDGKPVRFVLEPTSMTLDADADGGDALLHVVLVHGVDQAGDDAGAADQTLDFDADRITGEDEIMHASFAVDLDFADHFVQVAVSNRFGAAETEQPALHGVANMLGHGGVAVDDQLVFGPVDIALDQETVGLQGQGFFHVSLRGRRSGLCDEGCGAG